MFGGCCLCAHITSQSPLQRLYIFQCDCVMPAARPHNTHCTDSATHKQTKLMLAMTITVDDWMARILFLSWYVWPYSSCRRAAMLFPQFFVVVVSCSPRTIRFSNPRRLTFDYCMAQRIINYSIRIYEMNEHINYILEIKVRFHKNKITSVSMPPRHCIHKIQLTIFSGRNGALVWEWTNHYLYLCVSLAGSILQR